MIISNKPQRGDTLVELIIHPKYLRAPEGRNVSRQYYIQNNIYIRKTIYIITKTEIQKPMNRLKGILFISFPTNKRGWVKISFQKININIFV